MDDAVAEWAPAGGRDGRTTSVSRLLGEVLLDKMRHDDAYERAFQDWMHRERTWRPTARPTRPEAACGLR